MEIVNNRRPIEDDHPEARPSTGFTGSGLAMKVRGVFGAARAVAILDD